MQRVVLKPFSKDKFELEKDYKFEVNIVYLTEIYCPIHLYEVKHPLSKGLIKIFDVEGAFLKVEIEIHKGFLTNGADIPRFLWSFFPPNSPEYLSAVVIHDFLCDIGSYEKDLQAKINIYKLADYAFYKALLQLTSAFKAKTFYFACKTYHKIALNFLKILQFLRLRNE